MYNTSRLLMIFFFILRCITIFGPYIFERMACLHIRHMRRSLYVRVTIGRYYQHIYQHLWEPFYQHFSRALMCWWMSPKTVLIKAKFYMCPGGRFKNTFELLNLRALKFSLVNKIHIFQCMGKIFCVEFQRYPLKFHTKYLAHTLKDIHFIQHWKFKSS